MLEHQHIPQPWSAVWWQRGIFYQLIVRSFQDSDGDGSGDLEGLIARLDYLKWLGVDVIWISPIYPSPLVESGYDISDYTGVHPLFGSLATFNRLLAAAHARDLRVIIDAVPNHSSDQHPWFIESRASRTSPRRDWYLWADPAPDGGPPNNWVSVFGGSAWTLDAASGQYYYHSFLPQQPDLNGRNPAVRAAMLDVLRFWLDRGVDGFRLDAVWHIFEDKQLRDNPPNPDDKGRAGGDPPDNKVIQHYTRDLPEMHELLAELRRLTDSYDDRLLAGELYLPIERLVAYYGLSQPELHLPFNLMLGLTPWSAQAISEYVSSYLTALPPGAWPTWTIGTHDYSRVVSRIGAAQARVAALLLLTLPGTPTIYYGDEIGMADVELPRDQIEDPQATTWPGHGRDPVRTPMQWDSSPGAGFTTGTPWKPIGDNDAINVATQRDDSRSMLTLYQRLIALRHSQPLLIAGAYVPVAVDDDLLAYKRIGGRHELLVALNMGRRPRSFNPVDSGYSGRIVLTTHLDREGELVERRLALRPNEGIIIELQKQ